LLLAEGKSSKEIAKELGISSHTVDTHRRHLLEKTNCIDTTGMITYCKLVGLL
jgi:DNA-binding CsgD family transcriptional regulator